MKKGKGGRPKTVKTEGHACLEPGCYYYGITDQTIHALEVVEKVMLLEADGVETAVLEEVYRVRESTIRTWLARGGEHGRKLHDRFFRDLLLDHVQLDELWGNVKRSGSEVWVWVAAEVKTKIIPVIQVGERSQAMAYSVVHNLKSRLRDGCVPILSSDGLKHYFYAITAHFGYWHQSEGEKKPTWMVWPSLCMGRWSNISSESIASEPQPWLRGW